MSKIPEIREFQNLPVVTSSKMKYLDKKTIMEYAVKEELLMDNAGKKIFEETIDFIKDKINKKNEELKISIFCGRGNNGGDGLISAKYFKQANYDVQVFIVSPNEKGYNQIIVSNIEKAKEMGIKINLVDFNNIEEIEKENLNADVLIDALLGISALGKPLGVVKRLIHIMNKLKKIIISVDIPSGLNPDTGHHSGVFIKADLTITLGFAKTGLMANHAQKNIGILKVVSIGYPEEIINLAR